MSLETIRRHIRGVMFRAPMMINCQEFEAFIVEYLEGGLTSKERFLFDLHLKVCRECRDYLTAYKASMLAAQQGLSDDEDASALLNDVPEDLITAVISSRADPAKTDDPK
ncbi:MAG: zf-HC2 domain-containing protein [Paracoccaceae bacterium]